MNPCESQKRCGTRSLSNGSTFMKIITTSCRPWSRYELTRKKNPQLSDPHYSCRGWFHRETNHRTMQLPWRKMRHQVNHTLTTKTGAACLGILLNLISKSAAHCTWWSHHFLSHGTPWLRCLLQRSPHPVWFCSTHVDRRPLSNGAVVTPAKKAKTDLLSTKQDAHMLNGERTIAKNSRFALLQKGKQHPSTTQKKKVKGKITWKDWTTQIKRWGTTSKKNNEIAWSFTLFFPRHVGLLTQPIEHFSLREAEQMSAEAGFWI